MTPMSLQDLAICREVHAGMTSKERNNINYLFLEPVDHAFFQDYLVVVKRPMDLRTLKENLEGGNYSTREEFYSDAKLIFDNAVLFNKDRDSAFVVKLAESMTKALERLRRNAEKKAARLAAAADGDGVAVGDNGDFGGNQEGGEKKSKKISIKLKRQKSTSSLLSEIPTSSSGDSPGGGVGDVVVPPAKKVKAKLKLKLSSSSSSVGISGDASNYSKHKKSGGDDVIDVEKYDSTPMNVIRRAQCYKVLSSLKRRQPAACKWFHKPVSDPALVRDYREKIAHPMDLSTISSKLDKNQYATLSNFVMDLRLIASNCLQYNTTLDDSFRPIATEFLSTVEDLCKFFIAKPETPNVVYPSLLYCWTACVEVIDELVNMTNPVDRLQTAWFFLHPVTYFCGGEYPQGYLEKVKKPIDFGTIVQNLLKGRYNSVGSFATDCRQVVENCRIFYAGEEEGASLCEQANRLHVSMERNLGPLLASEQSGAGAKARDKAASKYIVIKRPEKDLLRSIMSELREATYTDKTVNITEKATLHFEKPVDATIFTDYPQFVETPMDLETVDRNIESGSYATPEDFEYDISLIFKNCERYNVPKKNIHMVNLGKHTGKIFRKLFAEKMRGGSSVSKHPSLPTLANKIVVVAPSKIGGKKRPASPIPEERPTKRVSIKGPSKAASFGKSVPNSKKLAKKMETSAPPRIIRTDLSAPIPMHVAIASIKESYPGRRQNKDLEGWEAECLKFMRQLMRHPWVSAERPKYIFHVPVHFVFPEIREEYAAKIKKPMDLTTAESKLLEGVYKDAEEFISDIALVFSNAIAFNKEGHDVGEPMSCAYHEASTHLLKYIRWLSLDLLQSCVTDCSYGPVIESGSAPSWKLSTRNRELARKEMESIVFDELIDTTEPGDKYSWSEQECEKLLKSLRHTSDIKHMGYFVEMNFPADYTAFISKPIAWEKCKGKLHERKYNTIGQFVADLRLIFSNALKYNEGARNQSKVSGMAYDSAIHMSGKLEAAIDKMLLTVSDRIGRERIDMITSHRELEAKVRAEEEQRKLQWEKENPGSTVEVKTKLRIVSQRSHRRKMTDFEFPFYDEEDDQEESHADSMQHAKALYEKQREARANMQEIALSIGISVFRRLQERAAAKARADQMYKQHVERIRIEQARVDEKKGNTSGHSKPEGACVSAALNDINRKQIKISISMQQPKKQKRKVSSISF